MQIGIERMYNPHLVSRTAGCDVVPFLDQFEGTLARGAKRPLVRRAIDHRQKHDVALVTLKLSGNARLDAAPLDLDTGDLLVQHGLDQQGLRIAQHGDDADGLAGIPRVAIHRLYGADDATCLTLVCVFISYSV